eukprot:1138745-Pelagomonas_calceolata.AAC.1
MQSQVELLLAYFYGTSPGPCTALRTQYKGCDIPGSTPCLSISELKLGYKIANVFMILNRFALGSAVPPFVNTADKAQFLANRGSCLCSLQVTLVQGKHFRSGAHEECFWTCSQGNPHLIAPAPSTYRGERRKKERKKGGEGQNLRKPRGCVYGRKLVCQ